MVDNLYIQTRLDASIIIRCEISPNSKENGVKGVNEWRNRLQLDIAEPAVSNRANLELISYLSKLLGIDKKQLEIISGHKTRLKSVLVVGLSVEVIQRKLSSEF